jgi:hypothetical protein
MYMEISCIQMKEAVRVVDSIPSRVPMRSNSGLSLQGMWIVMFWLLIADNWTKHNCLQMMFISIKTVLAHESSQEYFDFSRAIELPQILRFDVGCSVEVIVPTV